MATNKSKIINNAQKYIQKGNFDKAIRELRKLVDDDPSDVRTLLKIGDIYSKKGDREEATAVYSQVAESYSEQGFFLKAVAVYKQILKYDARNLEVTLKLAELYEHLGLMQEAMAQYQAVANMHDEAGDVHETLAVLKRMVELDPDNVASRVRLAEGYSEQQLREDAVEQFDKAAQILKNQGRQGDYIKVAERLAFHDPARLDVLKELSEVYLKRGDAKRAIAKLQTAFKQQPEDVDTLNLLARAFTDLGQTHKTVFVYRELARVYKESGRPADSQQILERLLEIAPGDAEAMKELGRAPAAAPPEPPAEEVSDAISQPVRTRSMTGQIPIQVRQPIDPDQAPEVHGARIPMAQNPGMTEPGRPVRPGLPSASMPPPGQGAHHPNSGGMPSPSMPAPGMPSPSMPAPTPFEAGYATPNPQGTPTPYGTPHPYGTPSPVSTPNPYETPAPIGTPAPAPTPAPAAAPTPPMADVPIESEAEKLLTETDVYIKYNLKDKALEHLRRVIAMDDRNVAAFEKMRDIYRTMGDNSRAAESVANLVRIHAEAGNEQACDSARAELKALAPGHPAALPGTIPPPSAPQAFEDTADSIDIDVSFGDESGEYPDLTAGLDEPLSAPSNNLPEPDLEPGEGGISLDLMPGADEPLAPEEPPPEDVNQAMVDVFRTGELDIPFPQPPPGPPHAIAGPPDGAPGPADDLYATGENSSVMEIGDEDLVEVEDSTASSELEQAYAAAVAAEETWSNQERSNEAIIADLVPSQLGPADEAAPAEPAPPVPPVRHSIPLDFDDPVEYSNPELDVTPFQEFDGTEEEEITEEKIVQPPQRKSIQDLSELVAETTADLESTAEADEGQIPIAADEDVLADAPVAVEEESGELGLLSSELEGDDMLLGLDSFAGDDADPEAEEELDEAEFLIAQELYEEAREQLLDLLERIPLYPRAVKMLDQVEDAMGLRKDSGAGPALGGLDEIFANAIVGDGDGSDGSPKNGTPAGSERGEPSDPKPPKKSKKNKISYL